MFSKGIRCFRTEHIKKYIHYQALGYPCIIERGQLGGLLPISAYNRRLCPKGVPISGFRYKREYEAVCERVGKSLIASL